MNSVRFLLRVFLFIVFSFSNFPGRASMLMQKVRIFTSLRNKRNIRPKMNKILI